tara:strand:- start:1723 stop:2589 length:867 start_codon:yes stop_codon:yes gene_type:complete
MRALYNQQKTIDPELLSKKIKEFLAEDRADQDITTAHISSNHDNQKTAHIIAEENMVFAGEQILKNIFNTEKHQIIIKDGMHCNPGDIIATVFSKPSLLLTRERVTLNLLQRLSGIASLTNQYVEIVGKKIKILDTRKTTPGLRVLEKYAVTVGGGFNHRLDLEAGSMFKDNHLILSNNFNEVVYKFKKKHPNKKLQIEVDTYEQLYQICTSISFNIDAILLDNMGPDKAAECSKLIRKLQPKCFIELSGGITLKNILNYKKVDIDGISVGALTHQAQSKNIKLDIQA